MNNEENSRSKKVSKGVGNLKQEKKSKIRRCKEASCQDR